jgi:signal transduction protein with GAF and PtsI domain
VEPTILTGVSPAVPSSDIDSRIVVCDASHLRGLHATLRIGCVAELALQQVQSFMDALYASDPYLEIELRHLPSAAQVRALQSDERLDRAAIVLAWRAPANAAVSPLLEVARAAARELRGG